MAVSLLLADDSPTIAKILSLALSKEDYAVRSVATSDKALEEIHKDPPELFLVDISLPVKNGKEFIKYIRNAPKLAQIKVILVANAFEPVDEAELLAGGADGVLTKPFDPATLRQKLKEVLGGSSAAMPPPIPPEVESNDQLDIELPSMEAKEDPIVHLAPPAPKNPLSVDTKSGFTIEFNTDTMNIGAPTIETVLPPPQNEPTVALELSPDGALNLNFDDVEPSVPPIPAAPQNPDALHEFFNAEVAPIEPPPAKVSGPKAPTGASSSATPGLFDVGGSKFAFSPDYVNRLAKAFEGASHESVPKNYKQAPRQEDSHTPVFNMQSSDTPPASLSSVDVDKMEAMIREEVRNAIQSIVPELAERIIREELERVMRDSED